MLTVTAIEGYKHYTEQTIDHAQYRIGSTWYNVAVSRKERMPDGRVAVYFPIIPAASTVTISGVRLYDTKGNLWAEKTESECAGGRVVPFHVRHSRRGGLTIVYADRMARSCNGVL